VKMTPAGIGGEQRCDPRARGLHHGARRAGTGVRAVRVEVRVRCRRSTGASLRTLRGRAAWSPARRGR
jgi:hypothetical protein